MKVPTDKRLTDFTGEIIEKCMHSQKNRINDYSYFRQYFYSGSDVGQNALYNRCHSHIDRLSSYLFSPDEVHFQLSFDTLQKKWIEKSQLAARYLSHEFHRCNVDLEFSHALDWALVKGCTHVKTLWGHHGLEGTVVMPEAFGVYNESVNGLDRQEAFNHQIVITKTQLRRMLSGHPRETEILQKLLSSRSEAASDAFENSMLHQIIIGGTNPVQYQGSNAATYGQSQIFGGPVPQLSPDVKDNLLLMNETWVFDEDREDYVTLQSFGDGIFIEGDLRQRNLGGVKGEQPFTQICANHTEGYYWGRSELALLVMLQDQLNRRLSEVDRLSRLRAKPPQLITGVAGISDQEKVMMQTPNGFVTMSAPNASHKSLAPEVPQELFEQIQEVINFFDDVGGFEAITKGQGESGVRSGAHAETLVRTATPRLRDRALQVERQCGDVGDYCFKLMQNKIARKFTTDEGEEFLLGQLPEGIKVAVDSHSSSPAFSNESKQLAVELLKTGSITPEDFILLTHPPTEDILYEKAKERAKANSQQHEEIMKAAKQDPSIMSKIAGKLFGGSKK